MDQKQALKELVADDRIEEAIQQLREFSHNKQYTKFENDITQLSRRFKEYNRGRINDTQVDSKEINQITKSLLELIDDLFEDSGNEYSQNITKITEGVKEKLTAYLNDIDENYQNVKQARRTLTAGGLTTKYNNNTLQLTPSQIELYTEQMKILIQAQRKLETLASKSTVLPEFQSLPGITANLKTAENYLRQILKEYEATSPTLTAGGTVNFSALEKLKEFTSATKEVFDFNKTNNYGNFRFKIHFSKPHKEISTIFKESLNIKNQ